MCYVNISRAFKTLIALILYGLGVNALYIAFKRFFKKGKVKILCFHDIAEGYPDNLSIVETPEIFEEQISYINANFKILSLDKAVDLFMSEEKLKEDVYALTFDDCYKGFLKYALPICKKYNAPFATFIATGPINTHKPLIYDCLRIFVFKTPKKYVDLRLIGLGKYSLKSSKEKINFINTIMDHLNKKNKGVSNDLQCIADKLEVRITGKDVDKMLLSLEHITMLANDGVTIGAHTVNHPKLTNLSSEDGFNEIINSKMQLEWVLDKKVDFFSYPFGDQTSFSEKVAEQVQNAGFKAAFTLEPEGHKPYNKFLIPRINVNNGVCINLFGKFSKALFAVEMSGLGDSFFGRDIRRRI